MRSEKLARDCSESLISQKIRKQPPCPEQSGVVPIVSAEAARMLVDFARHSCHAGLQLAVTKRIDTPARSKAVSDAATLLASGMKWDCSWRLLNAV